MIINNDDVRKVLNEVINSNFCINNEYNRLCMIKALENTDFLEEANKTIDELKTRSAERYHNSI